jgi:hypothetical protein
MNEFKDQLDAGEKDKVTKLIEELRELAVKGQAADPSVDADKIKEKIGETQQASLGLFQKVSDDSLGLSLLSSTDSHRYMRNAIRRTAQRRSRQLKNPLPRPRVKRRKTKFSTLSPHSPFPSFACTSSRYAMNASTPRIF